MDKKMKGARGKDIGNMIKKKTWEEFRDAGLLWWINTILHMFGWAIVFEIENHKIKDVYPARVKFRGFSGDCTAEGYKNLSKYLKENIEELYSESKE